MAQLRIQVPEPIRALDEKVSNGVMASIRILAGLLWLSNLEWKRPSDFGLDLKNGLYKYVNSAVTNPVFGPYSWFVEHIVLKQYRLFGWITLLTEAAMAIFLLLGLWTRFFALIGAMLSTSILLSVLYYPHEWPWSYFLMIGLHLMIFAVGPGRFAGLDGVRSGRLSKERALQVLGVLGIVVGLLGLFVARNVDFAAKQGALLGWAKWELKFAWFNPLSALLTVVGGVLVLAGASQARRIIAVAGAAFFAVLAVVVLFLWRYNAGKWTGGILGATGPTAAFWAMIAVGVVSLQKRTGRVDHAMMGE
jgi:uncharacterized membrane protein YphA (DoxX/SURF4 family)